MDKTVKILITGGTGFVGSHLLETLKEKGFENIHLTTRSSTSDFAQKFIPKDNIHTLDLTDQEAVQVLLKKIKPDQIYHLASISQVGNSFEKRKFVLESNLKLQLNLLEAIKKNCPQARLLSIGTALAYKKTDSKVNEEAILSPGNPYALSKLIQDLLSDSYAQAEKLDIVRVRPFNHIGERQALGFVVSDFAKQIAQIESGVENKIKVGNLDAVRDFTDVKDMVAAYILLMEKGVSGEVYNIGSGEAIKISELLATLISLAKTEVELEIDRERLRPVDLAYLVCDNEKIKALGWQPQIKLKDTLLRILNWWRENL